MSMDAMAVTDPESVAFLILGLEGFGEVVVLVCFCDVSGVCSGF